MVRRQDTYKGLSRLVISNRYKSDSSRQIRYSTIKPSRLNRLRDFLNEKFLRWAIHGLFHLFGRKPPFKIAGDAGVYPLHPAGEGVAVTLGLVADWANYTPEARNIICRMKDYSPDYTIHLGDTYYTGDKDEIRENFLEHDSPWWRGPCGSFALMGNHEMYSMARAYYEDLLPSLGPRDVATGKYVGQQASYFCLHTDHWLIIGLDTGYNSVGFPFVWNSFRNNCQLPDPLISWLRDKVRLADDPRGIVLLSHHQYVSGFHKEKEYNKVGQQIGDLIGKYRPVLWVWGHEHRLAFYGKQPNPAGLTAYGRCIGNGAMPIELEKMQVDQQKSKLAQLVGYDARIRNTIDRDNTVGHNGFALMTLNAEKLSVEYFDEEKLLLKETWVADLANKTIKGMSVVAHEKNPRFKLHNGRRWEDMMG